jgi:hypothetical protein
MVTDADIKDVDRYLTALHDAATRTQVVKVRDAMIVKPWSVFSLAAIRVTLIPCHMCVTSMYRREGDVPCIRQAQEETTT